MIFFLCLLTAIYSWLEYFFLNCRVDFKLRRFFFRSYLALVSFFRDFFFLRSVGYVAVFIILRSSVLLGVALMGIVGWPPLSCFFFSISASLFFFLSLAFSRFIYFGSYLFFCSGYFRFSFPVLFSAIEFYCLHLNIVRLLIHTPFLSSINGVCCCV